MRLTCNSLYPCFEKDCKMCYPPGALRANMEFSRRALSQILRVKLESYVGRGCFPRDPRCLP